MFVQKIVRPLQRQYQCTKVPCSLANRFLLRKSFKNLPYCFGTSSASLNSSSWEVCLVGRPNVGKSTIFNRMAKSRLAIVSPIAGTTRDRKDRQVFFSGMEFRLVDTGGLEEPMGSVLPEMEAMLDQTKRAVSSADLVLFVIDAREGVTPLDRHFAQWVRKENKGRHQVKILANKSEGDVSSSHFQECFLEAQKLGFGPPIPVSGEHGDGMGDLAGQLIPLYDQWKEQHLLKSDSLAATEQEEVFGPMSLAILGRPNVGKSCLVNALLGDKRVLSGPMPGLTRDSIAVDWEFEGKKLRLVDTAGLRRAWKQDVSNSLEKLSAKEAIKALNFANVCIVMLDAREGRFVSQEMKLLDLVKKEKRGLVIAANKSDLLSVDRHFYQQQVKDQLEKLLPTMSDTPVVAISALTGEGLSQLIKAAINVNKSWNTRIPTATLNYWLKDALHIQPPPREVKIRYITQIKGRPPTFVFFTNQTEVPETYLRFLRRRLVEDFKLFGVSSEFVIRKQAPLPASQRKSRNGVIRNGRWFSKNQQTKQHPKKLFLKQNLKFSERIKKQTKGPVLGSSLKPSVQKRTPFRSQSSKGLNLKASKKSRTSFPPRPKQKLSSSLAITKQTKGALGSSLQASVQKKTPFRSQSSKSLKLKASKKSRASFPPRPKQKVSSSLAITKQTKGALDSSLQASVQKRAPVQSHLPKGLNKPKQKVSSSLGIKKQTKGTVRGSSLPISVQKRPLLRSQSKDLKIKA